MASIIKFGRFLATLILVIGLISAGSLWFWWKNATAAPSQSQNPKLVVIPRGASAAQIGRILAEDGLVKDPFVFRISAQLQGDADKIIAGAYKLSPDHSVTDLIAALRQGPSDIWVTIPEGFRREQIAAKFSQTLTGTYFNTDRFLALTQNSEGYLFPDTYLVPVNADADTVVKMLTDNFNLKTKDILNPPFPNNMTSRQVIILASVIERETKDGDQERQVIAGILLKRLTTEGWDLQTDASLQYAVDSEALADTQTPVASYHFWQPLTPQARSADSPYNAYLHSGLPPMPIASPGLSSIQAVLSPQDSPYWYYLHDTSGAVHFAATYEEHQANIAKYLNN